MQRQRAGEKKPPSRTTLMYGMFSQSGRFSTFSPDLASSAAVRPVFRLIYALCTYENRSFQMPHLSLPSYLHVSVVLEKADIIFIIHYIYYMTQL